MLSSTEVEMQPMRRPWPGAVVSLLFPEVGMERVARAGSTRWPLIFAIACALLAGAAVSSRVDARQATLEMLEATGQLQSSSDRQIEDATRSAERTFIVKRIALAAVQAPLDLGLFAAALLLLAWFLRGRMRREAVLPVAASALLPGAVANLLEAGAALGRTQIPPSLEPLLPRTLASLAASFSAHPLGPTVAKLLGAFDLFSLWSALLLGYGLAAGGDLPRKRALSATLVAWLCVRLITKVAIGGP